MRKNISTNTPSEQRVGYSRAVIVDKTMYVSGTTSIDNKGKTVGKTVYEQTDYCFTKIKTVLENNGFSRKDVVLITAYSTNMKNLEEFDAAFIKHFSKVKPCCSLVGVNALVKPDLLIEIACIAQKP